MSLHWTMDDIPWHRFDRTRADPDIVRIVRAAAMVESNARDYAEYLCDVFHDDPDFQQAAIQWAAEEVQHGVALGRWATMVDPSFDYDACLAAFRAAYQLPQTPGQSLRGSLAGELIARCMVEVGTSSYYTAIAEATDEPVLQEICKRIATDEWRHYGLFYRNLSRYLEHEQLSRPRRLWIALNRAMETEDDELACAYHFANHGDEPYDRKAAYKAYAARAFSLYQPNHIDRAMAMIFKAVGFQPHGPTSRLATRAVRLWMGLRFRQPARTSLTANA